MLNNNYSYSYRKTKNLYGRLIKYLSEGQKCRREYPQSFNILKSLSYFPRWRHSQRDSASPMADRLPWITFAAIDFLAQNLRPDMKVFEWGIGGSTLFLLPRVAELVSVEHDRAWGESAQQKITEMGLGAGNWNFSLVTPSPDGITTGRDPANADDYISSEAKFQGQNFKDYVTAIDRYADGYFDIILIDGRARPSCFKHAIEKVKVGGYVLWDNTDRIHYDQTMQAVDPAYQFIDLPGPSPYVPFFTRTSVWQRR